MIQCRGSGLCYLPLKNSAYCSIKFLALLLGLVEAWCQASSGQTSLTLLSYCLPGSHWKACVFYKILQLDEIWTRKSVSSMPSSCRNLCSAFSVFQLCFLLGVRTHARVSQGFRGVFSLCDSLFWDVSLSISSFSRGSKLQFPTLQLIQFLISAYVQFPYALHQPENVFRGKAR